MYHVERSLLFRLLHVDRILNFYWKFQNPKRVKGVTWLILSNPFKKTLLSFGTVPISQYSWQLLITNLGCIIQLEVLANKI